MQTFDKLRFKGIRNNIIFLDVDGTLVHDDQMDLNASILKNLFSLKKNNTIYLCSNRKKHNRNATLARRAGVKYLKTELRKPSSKIVSLVKNPRRKKFIVIGDKWITDGKFAKRIGADFIRVRRLEGATDKLWIKFVNKLDDLIGQWLL